MTGSGAEREKGRGARVLGSRTEATESVRASKERAPE